MTRPGKRIGECGVGAGAAYRRIHGRNDDAPDRIRTCDLRLRRPTLYPAELQTRCRWIGRGRRITVTPPARQITGAESGSFGYPCVLDRPAADALPVLAALGHTGAPSCLCVRRSRCCSSRPPPAPRGDEQRSRVRIAELSGPLAGPSVPLGLVRWPSPWCELARALAAAREAQRVALAARCRGAQRRSEACRITPRVRPCAG